MFARQFLASPKACLLVIDLINSNEWVTLMRVR
jgi:hypothetical protein